MYQIFAQRLKRFLLEDDGPTAVEYAVMVALIVGTCLVSVGQMATATKSSFNASGSAINSAMSP
jgi:pilus assembly protein Flp/PilA